VVVIECSHENQGGEGEWCTLHVMFAQCSLLICTSGPGLSITGACVAFTIDLRVTLVVVVIKKKHAEICKNHRVIKQFTSSLLPLEGGSASHGGRNTVMVKV